MKPILVDSCNHFDGIKSICTKCGRSLPDVCLEFEQMKQKAEAYDKEHSPNASLPRVPDGTGGSRADDSNTPPAPVVKPRGRPKKVTNETNATD